MIEKVEKEHGVFLKGSTVAHERTGFLYKILDTPENVKIESSGQSAYRYKSISGIGPEWIRAAEVMEDGRFLLIEKPPECNDPSITVDSELSIHQALDLIISVLNRIAPKISRMNAARLMLFRIRWNGTTKQFRSAATGPNPRYSPEEVDELVNGLTMRSTLLPERSIFPRKNTEIGAIDFGRCCSPTLEKCDCGGRILESPTAEFCETCNVVTVDYWSGKAINSLTIDDIK